ncbi:MAG: DUF748 domain-containing protein, partial [Candidatus Omnitrophota bacterium]|nr:DUF748 domain-containing protein [Candidatus Omnitrophota bacterium]
LREFFRAETSIDSLSLSIPLTINIRGLQIGQLFRADNISFSPSILSLFAGRTVLNNVRIINPLLNFEMNKEGSLNLAGPPPAAGAKKGKSPPLLLTALSIKNGKFIFNDKKIMPQGYQTIIERVNIDISKTMLPPTSLNIKFRLQGQLADSKEQPLGAIYGSGWIDFGPRDMDGTLEIKEVELTYFAPYYGNFLSSRKLLSAKLSTLSEFKAKNNALKITTQLKLHDLVYAQQDSEKINPTSIFELAQNALDLFLDPSGNLNLQFTIDTRLDKPQLTVADLKGLILQAAIQNLSSQSPVELIKKGKQLLEQFKDFGKGLEDLF